MNTHANKTSRHILGLVITLLHLFCGRRQPNHNNTLFPTWNFCYHIFYSTMLQTNSHGYCFFDLGIHIRAHLPAVFICAQLRHQLLMQHPSPNIPWQLHHFQQQHCCLMDAMISPRFITMQLSSTAMTPLQNQQKYPAAIHQLTRATSKTLVQSGFLDSKMHKPTR